MCDECHLDHGERNTLLLSRMGNALCEECHDVADNAFTGAHSGVTGERGLCVSCHDPHGSAAPRLLRSDLHRPLAYGRCDSCHLPGGRLQADPPRLCFRCHTSEKFSLSFSHTPVSRGECLACHDPHGSRFPALLRRSYSYERWAETGGDDYDICRTCHDLEALTAETEPATAFRAGAVNLHRRHLLPGEDLPDKVSRSRGLTCRNCHEVHSSSQRHLVRTQLDCGGVPCLRLDYREESGGGRCLSGCHGPRAYGTASIEPPPAAPAPGTATRTEPEETGPRGGLDRMCISCHDREVQAFSRTYMHQPVRTGNCTGCHEDHGPEKKLVLRAGREELCGLCHAPGDTSFRQAHGGYALDGVRCTECHDPHSSSRPRLLYPIEHRPFAGRKCMSCHPSPDRGWRLSRPVNEICGRCHRETADTPYPHSAIARFGCTGCHSPHATRNQSLLRAAPPELCWRCHDRRDFTRENVHRPVRDGACSSCHPPHGSTSPGLLSGPYPFERFIAYAPEAYGLCWQCHDSSIFSGEGETGFRRGAENLHSLHLTERTNVTGQGDRLSPGVTCRNCHTPHSSDFPRLIRRALDCDGVPCLTLQFRKAGTGGKCLGGCHIEQSYLP